MSDDKAAVLEAAVPILSVTDLSKALDYYERILGFHVAWQWGEPPRLVSVCRNRVELNLSQSSEAELGISKVYFQMAGVDSYYGHIIAVGGNVAVPLADRSYGMRDFRIIDPSGNELSFGEAIDS
jgi:uncharacterized glyoxalase superfamily protein PhnB